MQFFSQFIYSAFEVFEADKNAYHTNINGKGKYYRKYGIKIYYSYLEGFFFNTDYYDISFVNSCISWEFFLDIYFIFTF